MLCKIAAMEASCVAGSLWSDWSDWSESSAGCGVTLIGVMDVTVKFTELEVPFAFVTETG